MDDEVELGRAFLDAFEEAVEAKLKVENNDGDDYDPCGTTRERVLREEKQAMTKLVDIIRHITCVG